MTGDEFKANPLQARAKRARMGWGRTLGYVARDPRTLNCCRPCYKRHHAGLAFRIVCGRGHKYADPPHPVAWKERSRRTPAARELSQGFYHFSQLPNSTACYLQRRTRQILLEQIE